MQLGYTMLGEQTAPTQLVSDRVRPEEVTAQALCGRDLGPCLDAVRGCADAGFTHPALVR
jgi:hypothetical protein